MLEVRWGIRIFVLHLWLDEFLFIKWSCMLRDCMVIVQLVLNHVKMYGNVVVSSCKCIGIILNFSRQHTLFIESMSAGFNWLTQGVIALGAWNSEQRWDTLVIVSPRLEPRWCMIIETDNGYTKYPLCVDSPMRDHKLAPWMASKSKTRVRRLHSDWTKICTVLEFLDILSFGIVTPL